MALDAKTRKKLDEIAARVREQSKTADVYRQSSSLENRIPMLGGTLPAETTKKQSPGLLSRVFDVISRPVHAVTSYLHEGKEQQYKDIEQGKGALEQLWHFLSPDTKQLKAAGRGLSGKEKLSTADLLKQAGYKNKALVTGLGFVGDIALDPTTYLSAGVAKGASKSGEVGTKALSEGLEKYAGKQAVKLTGKEVAQEAIQKATQLGLTGQERGKFIYKTVQEAEDAARYSKVMEHVKTAISAQPGKVQLKVFGKPIVESKSLYKAGAKGLEFVSGKSKTVRMLNRAFRTSSLYPEEVKAIKAAVEGRGFIHYERQLETIRDVFKGVGKQDKKLITQAIESRTVQNLPGDLRKLAEEAQGHFDYMWNLEKAMGIHPQDLEKLDNYVYHVFDDSEIDRIQNIKKKNVGSEAPGFGKPRAFDTLEDAKRFGFKPKEDIAEILAHRYAKHQQAINRSLFVEDMIENFAIKLTTKDAKRLAKKGILKESSSKYAKGAFFDREIADAIDKVEQLSVRSPETRHFLKMFDKIQNKYKFLVTAPNPGFHVRNLSGDAYNNMLDGVVSLRPYAKAARILMGDAEKVGVKVGKLTVKGDDLDNLFTMLGLKTGFIHGELGAKTPLGAFGRFTRKTSEYREDFARMAHFIDALKKEGKGIKSTVELQKVGEKAAQRVRKFNFDYTDLTPFEQNVMRRVVPFYTWLRKNIPLQMEMLATRPGRVAVVPKGMKAIEEAFGAADTSGDPFPGMSNIVPQWLRDMAGVRIRGEKGGQNPLFFAPQLPVQDLTKFTEDLARGDAAGALRNLFAISTPALRVPAEIATGKRMFGGAPIKSLPDYLMSQLPAARVGRVLTSKEAQSNSTELQTLLNYLLGAGVYEVTPQGRAGELKRMQDPLTLILNSIREKNLGLMNKKNIPRTTPYFEKYKLRGG